VDVRVAQEGLDVDDLAAVVEDLDDRQPGGLRQREGPEAEAGARQSTGRPRSSGFTARSAWAYSRPAERSSAWASSRVVGGE